jgi:tetratricopeptide (TPR) repeat protein
VKRGDAHAQAEAELELAGLYHGKRDYPEATRHYRRAAAAAEKAGDSQKRIDSLILLGTSLAQMGQQTEAQQQLELALGLAQQVGYRVGEHNALLQLQPPEAPQGEGEE